jgi:hypothetical protein
MRIIFTALIALSCSILSNMSQAQSTLGDPTPMLGDQGRAIAANTALGGAAMQRSNTTSPQEFARREQHKAEVKACRESYRTNTRSGSPQRKVARDQCEKKFQAQRATWYAKK